MNKKKLYFAPDTEIVDVLLEGVLTATSIGADTTEDGFAGEL